MSNLQKDKIADHVWEKLKYFFETDKDFKNNLYYLIEDNYDEICKLAEEDYDDYKEMIDEYLIDVHKNMINSSEGKTLYMDTKIKEHAYLIMDEMFEETYSFSIG